MQSYLAMKEPQLILFAAAATKEVCFMISNLPNKWADFNH